jgi:hypothetical protein
VVERFGHPDCSLAVRGTFGELTELGQTGC